MKDDIVAVNECWECGSFDIFTLKENQDDLSYTCQSCGYIGTLELPKSMTRLEMLRNNRLEFLGKILRRNVVLTTSEIAERMDMKYWEARDFLNSVREHITPVSIGQVGWVWASSKEKALSELAGSFRHIFETEVKRCWTDNENLYPHCVQKLRDIIYRNFPGAGPYKGMIDMPDHLLWMLDQIENMSNRRKAGRWIGYIFGWLEAKEIITNEDSRDMARVDARRRTD